MAEIGLTSLFVEKDNLFGTAGDLDISIRESERKLKERAKFLTVSQKELSGMIAQFRQKIQESQEETVRELSQYEVEELHFLAWKEKSSISASAAVEENPCRKLLETYISEHRPVVIPPVAPIIEESEPEEVFAEEPLVEESPLSFANEEEEIFSLDEERLEEYYSKVYQFAQDRECFYELPVGPVVQPEEEHVAQDTVTLETVELEPLEKAIANEAEALAEDQALPEDSLDKTVQRPLSFIKKLEEASLRLHEEEETDISLI